MKNFKYSFLGILLLTLSGVSAQSESINTESPISFQEINDKVIQWRRDIHQHPELGNREFRTAEMVATHLRSLGMEVQTGVGVTGVVGILHGSSSGPVIALRADMDGLPVTERTDLPFASQVITNYNGADTGVMHACGHDSHVAILMGVAEVLANQREALRGSVKFIFQPAEEGVPKGESGGAELMVQEGVLQNPDVDVIFGLHINSQLETGKISYRPGGIFAGVGDLKITISGTPSHGAEPWSAADPIVTAAQIIVNLQTIVSRNVNITQNPAVVTIGSIHGGNRSNIIPEEVVLLGTVRTLSASDEKLVFERIGLIATKTAEANGAKALVELPYSSHYPVTVNDPDLTAQMLPSLKKAAGESNVVLISPETGSEDFSFFANEVPGLYFYLGGMPKGMDPKDAAPHHTPEFYLDESGFSTGVQAFVQLVFDYMKYTH